MKPEPTSEPSLDSSAASPPEPVRLVIWDLDETLWKGALAEGAVQQIPENQAVVKELARRGIVSAICSRNDFESVKSALSAEELWEYFVFPSINWEAKGPRIQSLIERSQLRPPTVLFVDDNPSNLEEARQFSPGIQTADAARIPELLADPRLAGKPDPELNRLKHYQSLEQRQADAAIATGGVEAFLRQSDIRVSICYDLVDKLDRVVEIINRTNQLNFTKKRIPEDAAAARAQLAELLSQHDVQAGLLHVVDRYGDHGDAGFYAVRNGTELLHYCFSCRILGMGIETWLYRRLGRPRLNVLGEVRTDPRADQRVIDWIRLSETNDGATSTRAGRRFDWVAARGGCDLQALSHYFRVGSAEVIGEFNVGRRGFDARIDHSVFLRHALEGLNPDAIQESFKLGYRPEDFKTALTSPHQGNGLIVLSLWADVAYALYRHQRLKFLVPFALSGRADHSIDARAAAASDLPEPLRDGWMAGALATLQSDYEFVGIINEQMFKDNVQKILKALPNEVPVVMLLANTVLRDRVHDVTHTSTVNVTLNRWITETVQSTSGVTIVDIRDLIFSEDEVSDWSHFDRIVYYRLYERICQVLA